MGRKKWPFPPKAVSGDVGCKLRDEIFQLTEKLIRCGSTLEVFPVQHKFSELSRRSIKINLLDGDARTVGSRSSDFEDVLLDRIPTLVVRPSQMFVLRILTTPSSSGSWGL